MLGDPRSAHSMARRKVVQGSSSSSSDKCEGLGGYTPQRRRGCGRRPFLARGFMLGIGSGPRTGAGRGKGMAEVEQWGASMQIAGSTWRGRFVGEGREPGRWARPVWMPQGVRLGPVRVAGLARPWCTCGSPVENERNPLAEERSALILL